jgi:serine/threonine protein kinase
MDLDGTDSELEDIQRETAFLSDCDHLNCVKYFGSFLEGQYLYVVMELLAGGSIAEHVMNFVRLTLKDPSFRPITRKIYTSDSPRSFKRIEISTLGRTNSSRH